MQREWKDGTGRHRPILTLVTTYNIGLVTYYTVQNHMFITYQYHLSVISHSNCNKQGWKNASTVVSGLAVAITYPSTAVRLIVSCSSTSTTLYFYQYPVYQTEWEQNKNGGSSFVCACSYTHFFCDAWRDRMSFHSIAPVAAANNTAFGFSWSRSLLNAAIVTWSWNGTALPSAVLSKGRRIRECTG